MTKGKPTSLQKEDGSVTTNQTEEVFQPRRRVSGCCLREVSVDTVLDDGDDNGVP